MAISESDPIHAQVTAASRYCLQVSTVQTQKQLRVSSSNSLQIEVFGFSNKISDFRLLTKKPNT